MDISIISYGSRGDVQPFVAIARALRHVGHQVQLVGPANFAALNHDAGVPFVSVGVDIQAYLRERIASLSGSRNVIELLKSLRNELNELIEGIAQETLQACQGTDLILGTGPQTASFAERLGVPFIEAVLQPLTPTRAYPSPIAPAWLQLGGFANYLTHLGFEQIFWQIFRPTVNRVRSHVLGLPSYGFTSPFGKIREQVPLRLHAYSAYVMSRPTDWSAQHHVTGFWFLPAPADWSPPAELCAFLAAGPAPMYIGFGSMMGGDPRQLTSTVKEALARSGQRGILAGGWGALAETAEPTDQLFFVDSVPHQWLFPQMAAIVHHGGAGTTGAALRSGRPSIVVPFAFDQTFWGRRVAELGVGSAPIPRSQITVDRLVTAINQVTTQAAIRERAAQLGNQIQQEYGTAQAIDLILRIARR
ncbi:MAG: glycosyltransferase [Chloroflexi bacterium]|nr:glycosyltransferase [Chloroflexota bacterium]